VDISLMELVKVVILGIVEGLTEWLPVSSTGHMILVDEFIRLEVSTAFMDMFLVVIQLGAILAVVVLNLEKLNPFLKSKSTAERGAASRAEPGEGNDGHHQDDEGRGPRRIDREPHRASSRRTIQRELTGTENLHHCDG